MMKGERLGRKDFTRFFNRELQWLEFNRRVLHQASNTETPLLERLRFLGIFTSNLDEFVMKRVGGLKRQLQFGLSRKSHDGKMASDQLRLIRNYLKGDYKEVAKIYRKDLTFELYDHQIRLKKWEELSKSQKKQAREYYQNSVFAVLTPLVVDHALPFPFISNLSSSLAIKLGNKETGEILFGRVKIPEVFSPWVEVEDDKPGVTYVSLAQLISHNLQDLFPDMNILEVMPFRITRNADLDRDEEGAEDLLGMITEEIRQRRFAEAVRLEVGENEIGKSRDTWMLDLLKAELELEDGDVYEMEGLLDYTSLNKIADLPMPHLKFPTWDPQVPQVFQDTQTSVFDKLKRGDLLVHHPYESFTASVERFIHSASEDPDVVAIKMTLYRTNEKSSIISSLIHAAEQGKQVVCLVELKARFDEERNIYWAQQMEKVGIHVVYGVIGFKTHCKTTLVLRKENKEINAYCHIGTGNYNSATARVYTDMGLLTGNREITRDVIQLFHFLTGRSFHREFQSLLVAPMNMKERFIEMIQNEIDMAEKGNKAHIIVKCNSLEDKKICNLLYEASQVGVKVDLIIRGFCCLRPQVESLSENIRVVSVIGRFLEHSRLFFFLNGQKDPVDGLFYMGSADWMHRNLHGRVEVVTPIFERSLKRRCWDVLKLALNDEKEAWELDSQGHYFLPKAGSNPVSSQQSLMKLAKVRCHFMPIEKSRKH